jgi:hypothetical protein
MKIIMQRNSHLFVESNHGNGKRRFLYMQNYLEIDSVLNPLCELESQMLWKGRIAENLLALEKMWRKGNNFSVLGTNGLQKNDNFATFCSCCC